MAQHAPQLRGCRIEAFGDGPDFVPPANGALSREIAPGEPDELCRNVGERLEHLRQARDFLRSITLNRYLLSAPVYETAPIGCAPGTPAFLNTVVEIQSDLPALKLLELLQQFEQIHGRPREHGHNTPRTVDLDLLYAGDLLSNNPAMTLPHPRLHERRFALQPLADICPELRLPGFSESVRELLASVGNSQPIELIAKEW